MSKPQYFSVKNWDTFQHYKDRSPPWIKLYGAILDDYDFHALSDQSKIQLVLIWLLASRCDNKIPRDPAWLKSKLGVSSDVDLEALEASGFVCDWSPAEEIEWGSRYIKKQDKEEVMARDQGKCQSCGSEKNIEFDHITPVSKGGDSSPGNLQLLCRSCNRKKRTNGTSYVATEQVATHTVPTSGAQRQRESRGRAEKKVSTADFDRFWEAFNYKSGKKPAWKAWQRIEGYDSDLFELILAGAKREAANRAKLVEKGLTPKMAQGWITDRRWEDETPSAPPSKKDWTLDEWRKMLGEPRPFTRQLLERHFPEAPPEILKEYSL